jgi:hypothetical protein
VRSPGAVALTEIETLLPVDDEYWVTDTYKDSCYLKHTPLESLKVLQRNGNDSPSAWSIVTTCLIKDAQHCSNLHGRLFIADARRYTQGARQKQDTASNGSECERALTLVNTLCCLSLALPETLRTPARQGSPTNTTVVGIPATRRARFLHALAYNIHIMIEMARFMAHHKSRVLEISPSLALNWFKNIVDRATEALSGQGISGQKRQASGAQAR